MKTKHILAAVVTLSSAALADEAESAVWPIADPFVAFKATAAAAKTASLVTRVVRQPLPGERPFGTPFPFLGLFIRRDGENFDVFLSRATRSVHMKTADFAKVSLCDGFNNEILPFDFALTSGVAVNLERGLHLDMRLPSGGCFVPVDLPRNRAARLAFVRVPTGQTARVLPDGNVVTVPGLPAVHGLQFRGGRVYFPWPLVGDDVSELAVESVEAGEPDGPRRYFSASTVGRWRGKVLSSSKPPEWWPAESLSPPVLAAPTLDVSVER